MLVKLNVRTPCIGGEEDLEIECDLEWSILRVKEEIQERFQGNPKPEDQRLVYAGKLLNNESLLEHVLRLDDDEIKSHTVHLVCKQLSLQKSQQQTQQQEQQKQQEGAIRQRRNENTGSISNDSASAPYNTNPSPDFMRQYQNFDPNAWAQAMQHFTAQQHPNSSLDQSYAGNIQDLWMNQMYSMYMAHYMQYLQQHHASSSNGVQSTSYGAPANMMDLNNAVDAPNNPQQLINEGNNAAVINAVEEDDDGRQRDLLEWVFISFRLFLFFSMFYYYASFIRFAFIAAIGLFLYLWNTGFFRRPALQPENLERPQNENDDNGRMDEENRENTNAEEAGDNAESSNEDTNSNATVNPEPERPNPMTTAFNFVTTFFTSLLPEQQQAG